MGLYKQIYAVCAIAFWEMKTVCSGFIGFSQRLQYPLIKEYSVNHIIRDPTII